MLTMLLYVTFALALVLLVRRPAQQLFGAVPAFTLWLLPPLLALLPWLPSVPASWFNVAPMHVFPATGALAAQWAPSTSPLRGPYLLWAVGTSLCLFRLAGHYYRTRRQSHPLPDAMRRELKSCHPDLDLRRLYVHPAGPAVLWAPRTMVLLPADFFERFDAGQRQLVLRHEITHLRRGDALWSLLGELMLALLWFHPLAWLALARLRLDQELACDEQVLRQSPQDEAAYAHTLLHSTGMNAMPMSIAWLTQPQLKERLNMIQHSRPGARRRRFGFAAMIILVGGAVFIAQATTGQDSSGSQPSAQAMGIVAQTLPPYPESAVKNKQEGTVVLTVLVGSDGQPLKIVSVSAHDMAPDLIQAASDTVMQHWRFRPEMKDGKPVQGLARVPISFRLSEPAPTSSSATPATAVDSSKT